jgi:hypothetical protein
VTAGVGVGRGLRACSLPKSKLKKPDMVDTVISNVLHGLPFSLNQPFNRLMTGTLEYRNIKYILGYINIILR